MQYIHDIPLQAQVSTEWNWYCCFHSDIFPSRIFLTKNLTLGAAQAQLYILLTKFTSCITSESIELREGGSDCPSHWRCKESTDLAESCKSSCIARSGGRIWACADPGISQGVSKMDASIVFATSCYPFHQPSPGHRKLKDKRVSATRYQHLEDFSPNDRLECAEPIDLIAGNLQHLGTATKLPNPCKWGPLPAKTTGPWPTPSQRLTWHPSPQQSWVWLTKLLGKVTFISEDRIETHLNLIQLLYVSYVVFRYGCALCFNILVLITKGFVMPS